MRSIQVLLALSAVFLIQPAVAQESPIDGRDGPVAGGPGSENKNRIKVPKDFDTIQQAIDAAVDGDTIMVEQGLYQEVLTITGKRVNLIGNNRPMIHGPIPAVVSNAAAATGLVNYGADGGGIIEGFVLHGGDNGVVAYSERLPAGNIEIRDVQIRDTNRGVLVGWGGEIFLKKLTITNTAWHGIVTKAIKVKVSEMVVIESKGVGHLVMDTWEPCGTGITSGNSISDSVFMGNLLGGVVVFNSFACIFDSEFYGNGMAGMRFVQSTAFAWNNTIEYTFPNLLSGRFGDGIIVAPYATASHVELINNNILDSSRAGVSNFGSFTKLTGNRIQCASFELEGENLVQSELGPLLPAQNLNFQFDDGGGNTCGCTVANGSCVAVSVGLEPPEPAAPPVE